MLFNKNGKVMQETHSMFLQISLNNGQIHIYCSYSNGKSVMQLILSFVNKIYSL